jgi:hypothetical protein
LGSTNPDDPVASKQSVQATRSVPDSYVHMPFGGAGGLDGNGAADTLAIDPAGWSGYHGFDPWSALASSPNTATGWLGGGALSINLWATGQPQNGLGVLWTPVSGCASAIASGWILGCGPFRDPTGEEMWQWDPTTQEWSRETGVYAVSITTDLDGNPLAVQADGTLIQRTALGFKASSAALPSVSSVAAGSSSAGDELWVIRADNTIWNWRPAQAIWAPVPDATATKIAVFSDMPGPCSPAKHVPWIIDSMNNVYQYSEAHCTFPGTFTMPDPNLKAVDISTDFVVGTDGNLYQWDPLTAKFGPRGGAIQAYAPAPFGSFTRIGTWVNGIFAFNSGIPNGSISPNLVLY